MSSSITGPSSSSTGSNGQPVISFSGLASGIDTTSLVSQLVTIQSYPITLLQNQEASLNVQISTLGTISSQLNDLVTAAQDLSFTQVVSMTASGNASGYTLAPSNSAAPGSYAIQVNNLAQAASVDVQGLASTLAAGSVNINVNGTNTAVTINAGDTLATLAQNINNTTGIGVTASVINDGTSDHLLITNNATGYATTAANALQVSFTGNTPTAVNTLITAKNASFTVNGLPVTRQSNSNTDVVPNATLTLTAATTAPETETIGANATTSQANLQKYIDAYNTLETTLNAQLHPAVGTDVSTTTNGAGIQGIANMLASISSTVVNSTGSVESLADIGVSTQTDGTLTLNASAFASAVATNPNGVNNLFSAATTGIGATLTTIGNEYATPIIGVLAQNQQDIQDTITSDDSEISNMQENVALYQSQLQAEFLNMETTVSSIKGVGNQITALFASLNGSSSSSSG